MRYTRPAPESTVSRIPGALGTAVMPLRNSAEGMSTILSAETKRLCFRRRLKSGLHVSQLPVVAVAVASLKLPMF